MAPPAITNRKWWPQEVWDEQRDIFKAFVGHILQFAILIACLVAVKLVLDRVDYPVPRKVVIDDLDFLTILMVFALFSFGLVAKCCSVVIDEHIE